MTHNDEKWSDFSYFSHCCLSQFAKFSRLLSVTAVAETYSCAYGEPLTL